MELEKALQSFQRLTSLGSGSIAEKLPGFGCGTVVFGSCPLNDLGPLTLVPGQNTTINEENNKNEANKHLEVMVV